MAFSLKNDGQPLILVVDDSEAKRYTVVHLLTRAGYTVREAVTGLDGLEQTIALRPDLIILDINLPDISGIDVCRKIRQHADVASVIVLQLSATYVSPTDRIQGLDGGADAYITQPVENEELLATIKSLLRMRMAEKRAQKLAQEWEITFNSIESGVLLLNRDLSIARHNEAMTSFIRPGESLVGKNWSDFQFRLMGSRDLDPIDRLLQTLSSQEDEFEITDGRWIHITVHAVLDESGSFNGAVCILNDVTERQRANTELRQAKRIAEQASEAKTEFLANMSHEMRTPMNVVFGIANILSRNPALDERHQKLVTTLQSSADSLLSLINDLLDIAKIEARSVEIEVQPFDLYEVMQNVFSQMRIRALEKRINFDLKYHVPIERSTFVGDSGRLNQIMLNLIGNALKFTENGAVIVEVSQEAAGLRIDVRDSGIGIAPQFQEAIFQKFTQGDASINRTHGGTGLGLAITQSLVDMMGGRIVVESTLGVGSTFTVYLPLVPHAETGHAPLAVAAELPSDAGLSRGNILLVEDHPSNVLVATTLLEDFGFSVDVVGDGLHALEKMKAFAYDVVLMDVQMPGIDGLEATRQFRQYERDNNSVPLAIIGMTAHAMDGYKEKCLKTGMNDYISKPFNSDELKNKLHLYIGRRVSQARAGRASDAI